MRNGGSLGVTMERIMEKEVMSGLRKQTGNKA
jgi:hypothetical protein